MNSAGKAASLWLSIAVLCGIGLSGSPVLASEDLRLTGCLTKKGKLKRLEFGENPRKQCNDSQTLVMLRVNTDEPDEAICRARLAGTYLTTILNSDGGFASRSVVTLFKDGNVSAADSAELAAMFGQQQGSYRCVGPDGAKATTLDFAFSDPENIVRSDWVIDVTPEGGIEGEITVNFYRPLETCDPMQEPSECIVSPLGTFTFTSVRVVPSAR